ncbi:hypothetical protein SMF913_27392 [Streptomyces malaysiensis]|uniref:Glyoxalase/fosfomycin resistance/dioxygenase domain-containing protein n=1 Tax=Streptomyces malaysiensis TaxID=92644 RepID=A0A2J7YV73_STRMQ|nr:hypothetical protein SMF913_27392 [Streptomyces malaysiensis]
MLTCTPLGPYSAAQARVSCSIAAFYDEAIAFYVDVLGFSLLEDTRIDDGKRWVVVAPPGPRESAVLLARAVTGGQEARIGDQTGGRVGWFLNTAPVAADAGAFLALGGEYLGVAGVGVAPAQVAVQGSDLRGMAAVVRVGQGELPQWAEVCLDRVGPGSVGRGEAQLDLVLLRPAADVRAGVGGEVVQNDVDRGAVEPGRAD